ncbi:unnamed protein product [Ilex paraguariensis]|uniref:C2H2-type domain-containing protein n=1 Tax=Ilex paraguariensis TaxID=185542 RepID=A0ABC8QUC6_9AQUA
MFLQSPCEHAFCLDCARSDSICYLCDERIQKIQTIKMMEGIFICAAPHCLKSFLKKAEFESHIHERHADLLHPNAEKDGNESDAVSAKRTMVSDSTVQAPPRPVFSPSSNSQFHDREDKAYRLQLRDQPPSWPGMQPKLTPPGQIQNLPSEPQPDNNGPQGFDRSGPPNRFSQQSFDSQGSMQQDSGQFPDKQRGILSRTAFPEYPMHPHQPPNFAVPITPNPGLVPPPFNYPPFAPDGAQPYYGAPYEMARPDSAPEVGSEQGSLLGFPPGPQGGMNFSENYPRPWNFGPVGVPFEPSPSAQGILNMSDSQGRVAFFQGDYGRNSGALPSNLPPLHAGNKGIEPVQGGNPMDGEGILAPQPLQLPPPPPLPPPHMSQLNQGQFYSGEMGHDGQSFRWQHEKRDSFGSGQD